jgi:hypothetical protein
MCATFPVHTTVLYLVSLILFGNVKESRNRPGVAQSVPGGLGSQSS